MPRALVAWPDIDFRDDRNGGLFVATVRREVLASDDVIVDENAQKTTQKTTQKILDIPSEDANITRQQLADQKTTQKILDILSEDASITRQQLAEALGITADGVKYHLRKLQKEGRIHRVGPDKGGHWEVDATGRDIRARRSKKRK